MISLLCNKSLIFRETSLALTIWVLERVLLFRTCSRPLICCSPFIPTYCVPCPFFWAIYPPLQTKLLSHVALSRTYLFSTLQHNNHSLHFWDFVPIYHIITHDYQSKHCPCALTILIDSILVPSCYQFSYTLPIYCIIVQSIFVPNNSSTVYTNFVRANILQHPNPLPHPQPSHPPPVIIFQPLHHALHGLRSRPDQCDAFPFYYLASPREIKIYLMWRDL